MTLFKMYWHDMFTSSKTSSLCDVIIITHVILCQIRVTPGYFIKQVRPGWPGDPVDPDDPDDLTRLIWMTRPSCNVGRHRVITLGSRLCSLMEAYHTKKLLIHCSSYVSLNLPMKSYKGLICCLFFTFKAIFLRKRSIKTMYAIF